MANNHTLTHNSTPNTATALSRHPGGRCAGRRNAGCGPGRANGASDNTFSLAEWEPIYHKVDERPARPKSSRNMFRTIAGALLDRGELSAEAHAVYTVLLERSNNTARAVHVPIWKLAATLGWGASKTKAARTECIARGILVKHHRKGELDDGTRRQLSNRYGFCWTPEVCDLIGWDRHVAMKQAGAEDLVWNQSERTRRRLAQRAHDRASDRAQAERMQIVTVVNEIMETADNFGQASRAVAERFGDRHTPWVENFADEHLRTNWRRFAAAKRGRELASTGLVTAEIDVLLVGEFGDDSELLDLARAPVAMRDSPF